MWYPGCLCPGLPVKKWCLSYLSLDWFLLFGISCLFKKGGGQRDFAASVFCCSSILYNESTFPSRLVLKVLISLCRLHPCKDSHSTPDITAPLKQSQYIPICTSQYILALLKHCNTSINTYWHISIHLIHPPAHHAVSQNTPIRSTDGSSSIRCIERWKFKGCKMF